MGFIAPGPRGVRRRKGVRCWLHYHVLHVLVLLHNVLHNVIWADLMTDWMGQNDELSIKNGEFCIKHDGFCVKK